MVVGTKKRREERVGGRERVFCGCGCGCGWFVGGRGVKLDLLTSTDESYSKHRRGQVQSVGKWRPGRGLWVYCRAYGVIG